MNVSNLIFQAAFIHDMKEKATGRINVSCGDSQTVEDILTHIYGGRIENMDEKAAKLLAAADQYDLRHLKRECEELVCRNLNIGNCLDLLVLADLHSSDLLKPHVIRFVVENSREVVTLDKWREKLRMCSLTCSARWRPRKRTKAEEEWRTGSGSGKKLTTAPSIDSLYFRNYNA